MSLDQEEPWDFMSTTQTLTNFTAPIVVVQSDFVPPGYVGILKDLNVIFTTTGGTLRFQIQYAGGGVVIFTSGITANQSGQASLILPSGSRFQIVITTDGSGVIDVVWHGFIRKFKIPVRIFAKEDANFERSGGF